MQINYHTVTKMVAPTEEGGFHNTKFAAPTLEAEIL